MQAAGPTKRRISDRISDWLPGHKAGVEILLFSILMTVTSCIHYFVTLLMWTQPGFALDDSWIHLQFARTIYEGHPWEYSPGVPSTGSTSPLWSILLSSLLLFTNDPERLVLGTYVIATVLYCLCTFLVGLVVRSYTGHTVWGFLAMAAFVLFPRNTWLMLSGMETPLFVFMLMLSIYLLDKTEVKYDPLLGVVAGLAYLSRPEGILVCLVCFPMRFLIVTIRRQLTLRRVASFLLAGALALLVVVPWVMYCLSTTGYPLPDTFYAKVHVPNVSEIEAWDFWWSVWLLEFPFITIGVVSGIYLAIKGKPYTWLLGLSLLLLYRFSNPYGALINNARYLVPVFDLLVITAVAGFACLFQRLFTARIRPGTEALVQVAAVFIVIDLVLVPLLPEYFIQAQLFGNAVKNINEQQVQIGIWLRDNTPEDAVFAIHDAGALRFFSGRSVIDLAGLVTPAIVHGNMTVTETLSYLKNHGCDYFVFFDEIFFYWYWLPGAYDKIYTVHLEDNFISGRDTMSVFRVNWSKTSFS